MSVEEKTCRVCLGGEGDSPFVQPCACRGSAQWIHVHYLEQWRRTGPREDAAYRCGECKDHYRDALSLELLSARLQTERTSGQATNYTLRTLAGSCTSRASSTRRSRCTARRWSWHARSSRGKSLES